MKKLSIVALLAACASFITCNAWNQKGHDIMAKIAENHLTDAAAQAIDSILDGTSLVYWSHWLDDVAHRPEYAHMGAWHYKNVDKEYSFDNAPLSPDGDAVTAIYNWTNKVVNGNLTKDETALAIKVLVHVVGDLHQPMHLGRKTDLGGNTITVYFYDTPTNLHAFWDNMMVSNMHSWSYSEWQEQIDRVTPLQEIDIIEGTVTDWAKETYKLASQVYETTPEDSRLTIDYVFEWGPVVQNQLLKGGLRIAYVLNSLFDR